MQAIKMNEEHKGNLNSGAAGVKGDKPEIPAKAYPVTVPHLLYRDWRSLRIDHRSWYWKRKKELIATLLEPFKDPIPTTASILAELTSANILLARRIEGLLHHTGGIIPTNTLRDFIALQNSNGSNLIRLYTMAQNGGSKPNIPGLDEYLRSCAAKMVEDEKGRGK
jgi:hypothetical protein